MCVKLLPLADHKLKDLGLSETTFKKNKKNNKQNEIYHASFLEITHTKLDTHALYKKILRINSLFHSGYDIELIFRQYCSQKYKCMICKKVMKNGKIPKYEILDINSGIILCCCRCYSIYNNDYEINELMVLQYENALIKIIHNMQQKKDAPRKKILEKFGRYYY